MARPKNAQEECELGYYLEHPSTYDRVPQITKPSDMVEALRWYRSSAAKNWPGGQYHLGLCYLEGKGVEQDEERGLELIRLAADQQHPASLKKLSELYASGIGEPRNDRDRPVALLVRAAERNDPEACIALVFRYYNGMGVERDPVEAARWYCRAASLRPTAYNLQDKLLPPNKISTAEPFSVALSRFLLAAKLDPKALAEIGLMYLAGKDFPRSASKAWVWLTLASEHGASGVQAALSEARSQMSPDELKQAGEAARSLTQELGNIARILGTKTHG